MLEKKERKLNPGEIGLTVKDTGFLLSVLQRAQIQGSELKVAVSVSEKIEDLHKFLVERKEIIRGVH